jgi:hypothetical protein
MRVLQFAKRPVLTLATLAVALFGCSGTSEPTFPFNPTGASDDMAAAGSAFDSDVYASFSSLSVLFDGAIGAPLVSGSAAALDIRRTTATPQGAMARSADLIRRMMPRAPSGSVGTVGQAIAPGVAGKTFVYSGGSYVMSDIAGAPGNGVRFMLYAIDPVTLLPIQPLIETGYVDLIDLSTSTTSAARVIVVSQGTTYVDYRVTSTSTFTSGRVSVTGFITNGQVEATFNLVATLTASGLSLVQSIDIPSRDLSVDLTLNLTGTTPETSNISMTLDMRGQNGWVRLTGNFTSTGGTLNVLVNGNTFATITQTNGSQPIITGANGQPLSPEEEQALADVFNFASGTFTAFDQLVAPVGTIIS